MKSEVSSVPEVLNSSVEGKRACEASSAAVVPEPGRSAGDVLMAASEEDELFAPDSVAASAGSELSMEGNASEDEAASAAGEEALTFKEG